MAHESPLFQSAMELLGHSVEHFNGSEELDRKLVILHLANAVELVLKDLLLDQGKSIYKNPKETVSVHGAIGALQGAGVSLPNLNKVELLIDERNALQHRYGSPNEMTVIFYMDSTLEFFKALLHEHYDLDIEETLPQFTRDTEWAAYKMRLAGDDKELDNLKKLSAVHPVGAFLSTARYMENLIRESLKSVVADSDFRRRAPWHFLSHRTLSRYGIAIDDSLSERLDDLRRLRNGVTHGRTEPTEEAVRLAITTVEDLERALGRIDWAEVRHEAEAREGETERVRTDREARSSSIQPTPSANAGVVSVGEGTPDGGDD